MVLWQKTNKAKLAEVLERSTESAVDDLECTAWIFDGMAVLQALKDVPKTFAEPSERTLNNLLHVAMNAVRIDFVCDIYPIVSIKNAERSQRAKGGTLILKNITGKQKVPRQWKKFLSVGENKGQLSHYLAKEWRNECYSRKLYGKLLFVSHGSECHRICHSALGIESQLVDCLSTTQEEADTMMFLHVNHISDNGFSKLIVKSVDTDVEMLAIYFQNVIPAHCYILRSTKSKTRFVDIKAISDSLGPERCKALPGLHALMECDSTSVFVGKGNRQPSRSCIEVKKTQVHYSILENHLNWLKKSV